MRHITHNRAKNPIGYGLSGINDILAGNHPCSIEISWDIRGYRLSEVSVIRVTTIVESKALIGAHDSRKSHMSQHKMGSCS
jgi:hypothetical protein